MRIFFDVHTIEYGKFLIEINGRSSERSFITSSNGVLSFSGRRFQGGGNIVPMEWRPVRDGSCADWWWLQHHVLPSTLQRHGIFRQYEVVARSSACEYCGYVLKRTPHACERHNKFNPLIVELQVRTLFHVQSPPTWLLKRTSIIITCV